MDYELFRRVVLLFVSFIIFVNAVFGSSINNVPMLDDGNVPVFLGLEDELTQVDEPMLLMVDPISIGAIYLTGKAILGFIAVAGGVLAGAGLWDLTSNFRKNFVECVKSGWSYYADVVARLPSEIYNQLVIMGIKVSNGADFVYDNAVQLANSMGMAVDEFIDVANDTLTNGVELVDGVFTTAVSQTVEQLNTVVPNTVSDFPTAEHEYPLPNSTIYGGSPYAYKTYYLGSDFGNCRIQATKQVMFPDNVKLRVYSTATVGAYNFGWQALCVNNYYIFVGANGKKGTVQVSYYKKLSPSQIMDYRIQPYIDRSYDDTYTGYLVSVYNDWRVATKVDGEVIPYNPNSKKLYSSVFNLNNYSNSSLDSSLSSKWTSFANIMSDSFDIDMVLPNSKNFPYYLYFDCTPFDDLSIIDVSVTNKAKLAVPVADCFPQVLDVALPFPQYINVDGKILSSEDTMTDGSEALYDIALDNVYNSPSSVVGGSILTGSDLVYDVTGVHPTVLDGVAYDGLLDDSLSDYPYERDVVVPANPFDVPANAGDDVVDTPITDDLSASAETVSAGVIDALLKWLNNLIQALKNLFISLFIPDASFFTNWFYKIKTAFANKLGYSTYLDLLKGLANIKAIPLNFTIEVYGQEVTIIDVNVYARFYDILANFIRGFVYVFLLIFYLNNIYKFIRRDTFTHTSNSAD